MSPVAGITICVEGDPGDAMFVVLSGQLAVTKSDGEGGDIAVAMLNGGDFFGEMSLLDGQPRTATVTCVSDCGLVAIERSAFLDLIVSADSPEFALAIVSAMANRVSAATQQLVEEELSARVLEAELEADRHRSLAHMVAGVAHELNTPLGVANTAIGMIASRVGSGQFHELAKADVKAVRLLQDICEASDLAERNMARANRLIESFKKISVNQVAAEVQTVDIGDAVADVLELFSINAKRARLHVSVDDQLGAAERMWTGDPGQLTQVLTNLLANIERHAYPQNDGGSVVVSLSASTHTRVVSIADQGVGMDAETVDQIFTPFFTTARASGGSGLGLAIVHSLVVDAMAGAIWVDSTPGAGTTFTIELPAAEMSG